MVVELVVINDGNALLFLLFLNASENIKSLIINYEILFSTLTFVFKSLRVDLSALASSGRSAGDVLMRGMAPNSPHILASPESDDF